MIAVLEALPALLSAIAQFLGIGYLTWKLETSGTTDRVVGAVGAGAGAIGATAGGLGQLPGGVLAIGAVAIGVLILTRR